MDSFQSSPGYQDAHSFQQNSAGYLNSGGGGKKRQEDFEERRPIWKTAVSKEQKQKAILKNDFKQKNHFTCKNHLGNIWIV